MIDCKCKGCEQRHPGCHSDCPDYILFRENLEERNKLKEKERYTFHDVSYKSFIAGHSRARGVKTDD